MDKEEFMTRVKDANNEMITETEVSETVEESPAVPQSVDMWQERQRALRDRPQERVYGATAKLGLDLNDLFDRGIRQAYKKALDDSDLLRSQGETQRATLVEQQYMQDWFYPTVDALIRMNSMEEVLASQDVLEELDSLVIGPTSGSKAGYTSVYVSQLYEPVASQVFTSDAEVRQTIRRINQLCDDNQIRSAIALASQLQRSIDMGANRATPDDYEFVQRIALRGI